MRVCVLVLIFTTTLVGQYFGQNKVRYETFDFKVLKTEHFDIHYYAEAEAAAREAGRMAERWHARLSEVLGYQLPPRQPVILYASHPAFRSTTVIPDFIGETTGGVTEGLRRRVVMPLAGPMAETDHVLGHELVHAFQYAVPGPPGVPGASGGIPGVARLPLWFVEGMAEYLSLGPVDPHTAMWMRDAVRREDLPTIRKMDHPRYFPYRFGQAFWAYVGGRFGDETVGSLLRAAARGGNVEGAIQAVLKVSAKELSEEWHRALRQQYGPVIEATLRPQEQGRVVIPAKKGHGEINVSPVLSPDGKRMAFFSERDLFSIDLFLADVDTGNVIRKITETAVDPHLDSLQFANSAGAWSPDGEQFLFPTVSKGRPEIAIYDIERNKVARTIRLAALGEVFNPTWSPDGREVAFSAMVGGVTDLFVLELDGEKLRRLTSDALADLQPAWSPDGTKIAFVTDRFTSDLSDLSFGHYRLAVADARTGRVEAVRAFETGRHSNPQWSADGKSLYFLSDSNGIANIYRLSLGDNRIAQVTNIQTGVSGISHLSPAMSAAGKADRVVFSAFREGNYEIFLLEGETVLAGKAPSGAVRRETAALLPPGRRTSQVATLLERPRQGLASPSGFTTADYKARLGLDYVAPPTIAVGVSPYGSMGGGGTAFYFSDLLGHHNVMTAFQTASAVDGNFVNNLSAVAAYMNQKSRWTWGFIGGQSPFLTGNYSRGLASVDGQTAVVEQSALFWQINREAAMLLAYPFSRAHRVEFTGGFRNIDFAAEGTTRAFSASTGQLLLDRSRDLPTPDAINMGTASAALVYDTSVFGGTSPLLGQRYRLELGQSAGGLSYSTALADYRRYLPVARSLSLAGRFVHLGRYGGGAEDPRLQDLFLGYPSLVRGYSPGSFSVGECGPAVDQTGQCPVFDQLVGSRMIVANAEIRVPLLGYAGLWRTPGAPPVEFAPFYDMGLAWTTRQQPSFLDGPREPVTSYGASLRVNLLGFAIGQISYVRPQDRPQRGWMWEFSLIPGF